MKSPARVARSIGRLAAIGAVWRWLGVLLTAVVIVAILMTGGIGALSLTQARVEPEAAPAALIQPPLVRVVEALRRTVNLSVHTQGVVTPAKESRLAAEISGLVVEISPRLAVGGFFSEGDVLLKLFSEDYEITVRRAELTLEQAELRLQIEEHEAAVARREWELVGEGQPSALALHEPQVANARVSVAAMKASVQQAKLDLGRTSVIAPYSGRVRAKHVDVGEFVQRGAPLAAIYATDLAEVRLPIPDAELAFLSLPLSDEGVGGLGPTVTLTSSFAGRENHWQGRIVRTEGEIDARTGVVYAIAQVENPYNKESSRNRTPLTVGMFVEAEVHGRLIQAVQIPATAVRGDSRVLVVDEEQRIELRQVEVLRAEGDSVFISRGLEHGERVCISRPDPAVNGMRIRVHER